MTKLISEGQRNIAIATALANIVVGGIGFRVIHFFLDLPPNIKTTLNLATLFIMCAISAWAFYRVFLKKQEIPIGRTLVSASASSVIVIFTSPLGEYFVPASMEIGKMSVSGTTKTVTLNLTPIAIGITLVIGAIYLHEDTRKKVWKWLTEE